MQTNFSPWLYQLRKDRKSISLNSDASTDVAIIGAGIAGIATAFFTLKYTDLRVLVLERYKLAHGATGHNAGQVVSYFEKGFAALVDEFGLEMAAKGQKNVEDGWQLLDEMYTDAGLNIPFSRFLGHAGLVSYEQVLFHLENNYQRRLGGLNTEQFIISNNAKFLDNIPEKYQGLYSTVPAQDIKSILETKSEDFVAAISYQKGCVNSALFCEEVLLYLLEKYPTRFMFFENTQVNKIILRDGHAILDASLFTLEAKKVVLCTNGFTNIVIINENGLAINTKFHHLIKGTIGYMSGYLEKMNKAPIAISYLVNPDPSPEYPYFYFTRRKYEYEGDKDYNLISIGGPEMPLVDRGRYSHTHEYSEEVIGKIDNFVKKIYDIDPNKKIDYVFTWHGLMGYTQNGVRLIGPEPKNPILLYNLGCNGVGILPSVYGGKKICDFILGKVSEKAIFDVPKEYHND